MILGHAREEVVRAVITAAVRGTSFGAPTNGEVELAQMIRNAVPSMEMMRMVNSGTEAVMSAIRAARGYTGRDYIVKFEGCYHGHSDGLLVKAGSGLLTENVPDSAGVRRLLQIQHLLPDTMIWKVYSGYLTSMVKRLQH